MKTNSIYIFLISIKLLIVVCAGFWYMQFEMKKKIALVQQYHVQQQQNSNLELGRSLQLKSITLQGQENKIKKIFLTQNTLVSFVQKIERIAQDNALEITTEKIERDAMIPAGAGQSIERIGFSININGEYKEIKDFVEQVQDLETLTTVQDIRLYKSASENSDTIYNARIILSGTILSYE